MESFNHEMVDFRHSTKLSPWTMEYDSTQKVTSYHSSDDDTMTDDFGCTSLALSFGTMVPGTALSVRVSQLSSNNSDEYYEELYATATPSDSQIVASPSSKPSRHLLGLKFTDLSSAKRYLADLSGQALRRAGETKDQLLRLSGRALRRVKETKNELLLLSDLNDDDDSDFPLRSTLSDYGLHRKRKLKPPQLITARNSLFPQRHVADEIEPQSVRPLSLSREILTREELREAGWQTVSHTTLPSWLRDNDFLLRGHRPPLNNFFHCFQSIFRQHTETGNIWTHLFGAVLFVGLMFDFLLREDIVWQEKAVFAVFFTSTISCFFFSTIFHTMFCHSKCVGHFFCKFDYFGIVLMALGSFVPWIYYFYHCRERTQTFYLTFFALLGGIVIVYVLFAFDEFIESRCTRAGLGLSLILPLSHFMLIIGVINALSLPILNYLWFIASLYVFGSFIYAKRIPECWWPGKFDIWLSSHQLFHTLSVVATLFNYHAMMSLARHRFEFGGCLDLNATNAA